MQETNVMQDKELMDDMLTAEKHAVVNYSLFANECSTQSVRTDVMTLLEDEHKLQAEIFDLMSSHGWYAPKDAEMQKIAEAKQKYMSQAN